MCRGAPGAGPTAAGMLAWLGAALAVPAPSSEAAAQPSAWFQPLCTSQPSAASALGAP